MTNTAEASTVPRALSLSAFVFGMVSLVLVLIFFLSSAGATPLVSGVVAGVAAVVIGIVALAKRQPKGFALAGLIVGGVVVLFGVALILFALLFVGAITLGTP